MSRTSAMRSAVGFTGSSIIHGVVAYAACSGKLDRVGQRVHGTLVPRTAKHDDPHVEFRNPAHRSPPPSDRVTDRTGERTWPSKGPGIPDAGYAPDTHSRVCPTVLEPRPRPGVMARRPNGYESGVERHDVGPKPGIGCARRANGILAPNRRDFPVAGLTTLVMIHTG